MSITIDCDCKEVCGWTMPHTTSKGECTNCGTSIDGTVEVSITFDCDIHKEVRWIR